MYCLLLDKRSRISPLFEDTNYKIKGDNREKKVKSLELWIMQKNFLRGYWKFTGNHQTIKLEAEFVSSALTCS